MGCHSEARRQRAVPPHLVKHYGDAAPSLSDGWWALEGRKQVIFELEPSAPIPFNPKKACKDHASILLCTLEPQTSVSRPRKLTYTINPQPQTSVYEHAYYPVQWLTPIKGNERALQFDLSSNFARNYTISRALSTGLPASTSRLTLVQTANAPTLFGMILFFPVYQQLTCPKAGEKGDMYLALRRYTAGDRGELCPTLVGLVNAVFTIQVRHCST